MNARQFVSLLLVATFSLANVHAQQVNYKIHKYNSNDGGILMDITPSGEWALINLGTTAGGGTATSKLYHVDTEELVPLQYAGRNLSINAVSDDGNVVVGSFAGKAMAYNRVTDKITMFQQRALWQNSDLCAITPDGKWAVGCYNGYNGTVNGSDELSHDYYYSTLLVNIETGDTVATPGLPKFDMSHEDQHAITFRDITPDGRYVLGEMSWYIMQPNSPVVFIYDTQEHNYSVIGFTEHDRAAWEPLVEGLHHLEGPSFSPNGKWLVGMAYMSKAISGSEFNSEYGAPFRYNMETKEFAVFDGTEIVIDGCIADDEGTIIGNPNTGSPLRDFRILYKDKYWITLSQICKQEYGFSFTAKTGYGRTGTACAISGDGSRMVCFPDPLGESYCFDFKQSLENVCENIDLLDGYTVTPTAGSVFSQISTISLNFGRPVQVLGKGNTHVHLFKADGTKVADALSTSSGLSLKTGTTNTVNVVFRTRGLESGQQYYVVIDAGAIAVANDAERTNKEIRINYTGRKEGAVEPIKVSPEDGSELRQIDASSSYVLITFDCPVQLTEQASAYVERVEDGTRMATLNVAQGNADDTRNQVLLFPSATIYLYTGLQYRVVLEEGSVSDYAGSSNSFNEEISFTYNGIYVREVSNNEVLFCDDFSNPSESYAIWLRYEGDHLTPLNSMAQMSFNANDMPWQFGLADDVSYSDMYAGSHSLYAPSGQSDDWLMTPQLLLPVDTKTILTFDAQSYQPSKKDVLKVFVFEEDFEIPVLTSAWMEDVRSRSVLLDSITLTAGTNQETTVGEWTRYSYDLSPWAGKNIYVAFANQNYNQSMIFLDNVCIQRELLYTINFNNAENIVAQDAITLSGSFTVKTTEEVKNISLVLRDHEGTEISRVDWPSISGNIVDRALPFTFARPLPLIIGAMNSFTIDVILGDRCDTYSGTITDLAFMPTPHVVLEEETGIDCPNCPQGILSIQKCEAAFKDQFIPISIHTYIGDPYAGSMGGYTEFLGLNGAPLARINRISGIYSPMVSDNGTYFDTYPDNPVWYDIVAQELNHLPICDVSLQAEYSRDKRTIDYTVGVRYAINATGQQMSLFIVLLEDGIVNYQYSNLGQMSQDIFGEWGFGGLLSGAESGGYAYPFTHNDIARAAIGQTYSGTIGYFPTSVEADTTYTATLSSPCPDAIVDRDNVKAIAMLIDTQTGQIVNAARAKVLAHGEGLEDVVLPATESIEWYTLTGKHISNPSETGCYIRRQGTDISKVFLKY